jgi:predicted acetyltransferase
MILRELEPTDEHAFNKMLDDWDGASGFTIAFGLLEDSSFLSYLSFLNDSKEDQISHEGVVPSSSLFAFIGGEIVGKVNVRHRLNKSLEIAGGHLGFGVLPLKRGKGYATEMLRLSLGYCRSLGLKRVLLTCDETNIPSRNVILKNGGVLEDLPEFHKSGAKKLRFWINL